MKKNTIYYNNNLLYLSLIEDNLNLLQLLVEKNYPQKLSHLSYYKRKKLSPDEINKISLSYNNALIIGIKDLISEPKKNKTLSFFLNLLENNNKIKEIQPRLKSYMGLCFYFNNLEAFKKISKYYNKEYDSKTLQFFIIQARKSNCSLQQKKILCDYINQLGDINWSDFSHCFKFCVNTNIKIEDLDYFYEQRKKHIPKISKYNLRKEMISSLDKFLYPLDLEKDLLNPVLNHFIHKPEFVTVDPCDGYFWLIKKSLKLYPKITIDIDSKVQDLLLFYIIKTQERIQPENDLIGYLYKKRGSLKPLKEKIEKLYLKHNLEKSFPINNTNKLKAIKI